MVKAYVLLRVDVEEIDAIQEKLQEAHRVKTVDSTTGPFDMIAVVEAEDMATLGNLVTKGIAVTSGVISTLTCVVVK